MIRNTFRRLGLVLVATLATAAQAAEKPNILVIWGDDIGITNISAYGDGIMGYECTPMHTATSASLAECSMPHCHPL